MSKPMSPLRVYLILEFCSSLLISMVFTVSMVYQVTIVGLDALQLVLIGTTLEVSVFIFEVPTGLLADIKSRKLSVIVGWLLMGVGFIVEGSFPTFGAVAAAQVIWGLGFTFTSGATQAWIADEVGAERAGQAFLQGSQAARVGSLVAIPLSIALGTVAVNIPIVVAGSLMMVLALFLLVAMGEEGFRPIPVQDRTTWRLMIQTLSDARQLVNRQPVLLSLLGIGFFFGLYSEGFDRLWTAHLLESFAIPFGREMEPVVWIGVIRGVMLLLSLWATETIRRRLDVNHAGKLARILMIVTGLIIVSLAGFGLTGNFWLAVGLFWLIQTLRNVAEPLQTTWYNLLIDEPRVRATLFSATSQVDAIGQISGGPAVGAIGNLSLRAALVTSSLILSPALALYASAIRRTRALTEN